MASGYESSEFTLRKSEALSKQHIKDTGCGGGKRALERQSCHEKIISVFGKSVWLVGGIKWRHSQKSERVLFYQLEAGSK